MNEFEYYVIGRKGDKAFPSVVADQDSDHTNLYVGDNFSPYHEKSIPDPKTMEFVFRSPIPRKPIIGDYFAADGESIISKKIADILLPINIKGIQLIPTTVMSNKGDLYEDFYYIHIYHYIEAMDKETSDFKVNKYGIYFIDKFRLDEKVLKDIPLKERLVFKLKEKGVMKLYHQSVVDAMMATNPEGVMFTKVEDWEL